MLVYHITIYICFPKQRLEILHFARSDVKPFRLTYSKVTRLPHVCLSFKAKEPNCYTSGVLIIVLRAPDNFFTSRHQSFFCTDVPIHPDNNLFMYGCANTTDIKSIYVRMCQCIQTTIYFCTDIQTTIYFCTDVPIHPDNNLFLYGCVNTSRH